MYIVRAIINNFTALNKTQVLLVGVKKALAIKTSFRYNSFWPP